jgi:hypothetical protein
MRGGSGCRSDDAQKGFEYQVFLSIWRYGLDHRTEQPLVPSFIINMHRVQLGDPPVDRQLT